MSKALSNLRIGARLRLAFAIVVSLLLVLALSAYGRIKEIDSNVARQNHIREQMLVPLYQAREALDQTGIAARNAFIYKDENSAQQELATLEHQKQLYLKAIAEAEPFLGTDQAFAKAKAELMRMAKELERPARYRTAGDMEGFGTFLVQECSPLRRQIVADIDVVIRDLEAKMGAATAQSAAVVSTSLTIIAGLTGAALAASLVLTALVTRSIVDPLREAVRFAKRVASGDLTSDVATTSRDEIGQLLFALGQMQEGLLAIVKQVRAGADNIATAAVEVSAGNQDLSTRTEQTAAALEETAASTEQMNATVKQNADNAHTAKSLSAKASTVANQGGALFAQVVDTMSQIDQDSTRIGDIVGVIDGIAFQTNILALNAAVEAARAGEQGRGFAVVASEVRALAQRASAAAKEIKELIGSSGAKVVQGSELVTAAGRAVAELVEQVKQVDNVVSQISIATDEQAMGVELINKAVTDVDQITQQNAALVEEAAAAAQTLQFEADTLTRHVQAFKTR